MVRPRILLDIRHSRASTFSGVRPRLNFFRPRPAVRVPLSFALKVCGFLAVGSYALFGAAAAPGGGSFSSAVAQTNGAGDAERLRLEEQLSELERQIAEQEGTVQRLQKEKRTLQGEIGQLNANINKINLQLKATNISFAKLNKELAVNQSQIAVTEEKLALNKTILGKSLQEIYESGQTGLIEILLSKPRLSDFFGNVNQLMEVQDSLSLAIDRVTDLKSELLEERESLAVKKSDVETLKNYQESQRSAVERLKKEKDGLLVATKGKESKYQELLQASRKSAAQLRSRIFELLGGGELTFEEAYKFARFAEQATGVRAALILAVLDRESALGQNVGRCSYKTAMHPTRDIPVFLELVRELNINPESIMVSCPNRDGIYGGAMGPAQFIPSTWNLYKGKIAAITGSNPPSPWRNGDAFVATALYLKDAGADRNERVAAAKYYCGARWNRYVCTNVYGQKVVEQARRFQEDIEALALAANV